MREGESSGHNTVVMEKLEDMVLKWTLKDIMDDKLFEKKVKDIPEKFTSVKEYLCSFIWPLIEEMRAELQHSLEFVSQAPHLTIKIMDKMQSSEGAVETYEMLIESKKNDSGETQQKELNLKPKDILILCTKIPNNLEDFHDDYLFAVVHSMHDLETSSTHCEQTCTDGLRVKVKLSVRCGHPFTLESNNIQNEYFAIYLSNMITSLRIWNALHRYLQDSKADLAILPKAIYANTEDCNETFVEEEDHIEKFGNKHFLSQSMNDSQASAVMQAVNAVGDGQNSFIKLIQGPPGTGKTSMLIPLISALIHKESKLLVCAPTNAAISEVAVRFLKLVKNPSGSCPNTSKFPCIINLSDIVLLGSEERFDPDGPLADIFLTYRVERLVKCFLPMTGWRHVLTSLADFLELANVQYENVKETQKPGISDFAQYMRERLKILSKTFYECAGTILNDLPGTLSDKHELVYLIGAVESFMNLTEKDNVNERVLRECFVCSSEVMQSVANCSEILSGNMLSNKEELKIVFCRKRNECIALLRNQLHSMSRMGIAQNYVSQEKMEKLCLSNAKLVFSTVSSSGKRCMDMATPFECLIIDEAAQLKEAESTIALQISGLRHAILIGDPNQLPATVISKTSEQAGYGRSLFERLRGLGYPVHLLNTQYRMHPLISRFPNREFYENRIMDGPNVKMPTHGNVFIESEMYGNYAFINVKDGKEEEDDFGKSKKNIVEAAVVLHILSKLHKVCASRGGIKITVGVVSPYTAQVLYLTNNIMKNDTWRNTFDIEVKSVDGFQGGEKDIIIISTVRTEKIGFFSDWRRTNVAITRARFFLWIVGNGSMLVRSKSIWEKITKDAIARKCFIDPTIDDGIGKAIRHAKAELDQLQDLLNKDSVVFNNTIWKVMFSTEFKKSFTKVKCLSVRQQIINTMLKLANGWRQTRKHGGSSNESLINEYATSGLYLVWTTDVERGENAIQVLKIWNVLSFAEVPRLKKRLENVFVTYTPEYIERCKARFLDRDGKTVPKQWKNDCAFVWYKSCKESEMVEPCHCEAFEKESITIEHASVDESLLLMKFYSLSSGIANQLLTAQDGSEIDLQFEVNEEESQIIRFPRSLFVLGRSGTGKTTVLTARLLQKEQQLHLATHGLSLENNSEFQGGERMASRRHLHQDCDNGSSLQQLFVTVSPKLCSAIKNHISRINSFLQGKDYSPYIAMLDENDSIMEFENIPDSFIDIGYKHFPMVITFQKFLIMLDGSIQCQFFQNRCSEEQEGCQRKRKQLYSIVKTEVESVKSVYSCQDLKDDGEDADIINDNSFFIGTKETTYRRSLACMEILRRNEVNYEKFDSVYWPHFNSDLRRGLESSVVFTEIISHIKGSLKFINSTDFRMSKDAYIAMSERRISILSVNQREAIYDLFLLYEKQKQRSGNFDIADVVNHLHQQLRLNGYSGQKMNFIYVDEVQDLSMAQIALFKYVCSNISEGFVFAGDTAQTIARGINFRFEEIRNLFYEEFLAIDDNDQSKGKVMPDLFHLSQNFRTHTGITKLAQSVVEVLYHFFPFAIDKLHPETSLIYGEPPVFIDLKEDKRAFNNIFGHVKDIGNGKYEFGAEQAILVRDDCQKVQMLEHMGKQCLVLTILECKGLEFQDVLLYNFFSMSPLCSKWRTIYDFMDQKGYNSEKTHYPKFESTKYYLLCSELKHLYVAITRAKQRLWIYEENPQYAKPMVDYWNKMGIIQSRCLDRAMVETMYVASNSEEWKQKGIQMFNEKNYDMAIVCFERAGDVNRTKWAKASSFRERGKRYLDSNKKDSECYLKEAAEIFLEIEKPDSAATCYITLGDYKKAGTIYEEKCNERHLQDAGDCFAEARCWYQAASAYARANCVSECLDACLKGKLFETGLNLIEDFKREICNLDCGTCQSCKRVEIESEYLKKCATHYHQKKDTKSMMKFVKAFPEMDSVRSFLSRKDYFDELLELEVEYGNFLEAAEVAAIKGDLLLEADMLEQAGEYKSSAKSILLYVRSNSFWELENKGEEIQILMERLKCKADKNEFHVHQTLNCEIPILLDQSCSLQELTEMMIQAGETKNVSLEVLSIKKILDMHLHSNVKVFRFQHDQESSLFRRNDSTKMLLEHRISSVTLVSLWNAWMEKLKSSADALSKLEKRRERNEDIIFIEFAFEFFGVRMNRNQRFCTVCNSEASWLKDRKVELTQTRGNTGQISINIFCKHARNFLLMDLLSVGKEVIKKLEEIYSLCSNQHSVLTDKANQILQIYQVSKDIQQMESEVEQTGLHRIENLEERFFEIIFPLMRQYKNFKEFLCGCEEVRSSGNIFKDIAVTILTTILIRNSEELTLGQIGRLQVLLPLLPKDQVTEYGKKLFARLRDKLYWNNELLWLRMDMPTDITMENKRELVESFRIALTCTFNEWKSQDDYISPNAFLLLLEKLLFLSSSCHLSESLFLPRSFFVEFMTGEQGNLSYTWLLQAKRLLHCEETMGKIYDSVCDMVIKLLITYKGSTFDWIGASKMDKRIFPELALRLIIVLCLIYINSRGLFQKAREILSVIFRDEQIIRELPSRFEGEIHQMLRYYQNLCTSAVHFSRAMKNIDNPLVSIEFGGYSVYRLNYEDVIVLRQESIERKETILQTVFQEESDTLVLNKIQGTKCKENLMFNEKDILSSCSNNAISNSEHISESFKAEENVPDNFECAGDGPENGKVFSKSACVSGNISEQQKDNSVEIQARITDENIQLSPDEGNEPAHKLKVDGQYVPWFVLRRMKRWLSCARMRFEEQLPIKDKYIQEAREVFQGTQDSLYTQIFISKACSLKAEVDEFLDLIEIKLPKVCSGEDSSMVDEMYDVLDQLTKFSELLHPRHDKHEQRDIEWLENDAIAHTSMKLKDSKIRLKPIFEVDTENVIGDSQAPESNTKQNKKKKPKRNKKGGKRKK